VAYNLVFAVALGLLVVAGLFAVKLPGRSQTLEMQAARRHEFGVLAEIGEVDVETDGGLARELL
jgi:hypothetical protein